MTTITVDRLQETGEMLGALGDAFQGISMLGGEHEKTRVQILLMLSFIGLAVSDLALHLTEGKEIHDALRAVVRGERKLDADLAARWQKVIGDIENPMKKN